MQAIQGRDGRFLLSVVVPVYQEAQGIEPFMDRLSPVMAAGDWDYELIFCLDPSPDATAEVIRRHMAQNPHIRLITFSRRFGQPAATLAGIRHAKGQACVVIDVDLQDPPELISRMVEMWREGADVVYAQRTTRNGENPVRMEIVKFGYWLINRLTNTKIPVNTGDFRLMDRRVVDELNRLTSHHGFLRGMVAGVGFRQEALPYQRDARYADQGKYNRVLGSTRIGLNGLFCFSSKPLELLTGGGLVWTLVFALLCIAALVAWLIAGHPVMPGTALFVGFCTGILLTGMGVLGEYVSRIYEEVRGDPLYIIDEIQGGEQEESQ